MMSNVEPTAFPVLPWISSLRPYVPGKPIEEVEREFGVRDSVKLASNENPYGCSPLAVEAISAALSKLHLYPDAGTWSLRQELAAWLGCAPDALVLGNGSNEVITLLVRALAGPQHNAVVSRYAFVAYRVVLQAAGVGVREVPDQRFSHDLLAMAGACDADTRLLFVANPNNPTGTWHPPEALAEMLARVPAHVTVVIDEAYHEFVSDARHRSALELRERHENVVVLRTFSKAYGLAALRCGYGVVPAPLADALGRIREPFNVNLLAQEAARAGLRDQAFVDACVQGNEGERQRVGAALRALGLDVIDSQTNFLMHEAPGGGAALCDALMRRGVILRPLEPYGLGPWVRTSLGTPAENDRMLEALRGVLA